MHFSATRGRGRALVGYALVCAVSLCAVVWNYDWLMGGSEKTALLSEESTSSVTTQTRPVVSVTYPSPPLQYRKSLGVKLVPGAQQFYDPQVVATGPTLDDGSPMSQWSDIFQRMTSELSTDTMEIANLDSQIARDEMSNEMLKDKYSALRALTTRPGPPGPRGPNGFGYRGAVQHERIAYV
mmetsp:Transcript_26548/g.69802  ORF Transcript_26548/g.69802 Transcript_26548/m.69802 type:complete len:182 (+) Transcript_26548:51-596(+)